MWNFSKLGKFLRNSAVYPAWKCNNQLISAHFTRILMTFYISTVMSKQLLYNKYVEKSTENSKQIKKKWDNGGAKWKPPPPKEVMLWLPSPDPEGVGSLVSTRAWVIEFKVSHGEREREWVNEWERERERERRKTIITNKYSTYCWDKASGVRLDGDGLSLRLRNW